MWLHCLIYLYLSSQGVKPRPLGRGIHELSYARIKALAENSTHEMCVYIDSNSKYEEVYSNLAKTGYGVENYNGGNNSIIEVSWG